MTAVRRRAALGWLGAAALARPGAVPAQGIAAGGGRPRVVVVGGGPGGVAAARALAAGDGGARRADVLLVERQATYRAPWLFNGVLGGLVDPARAEYGYGALAAAGILVRHGEAASVDAGRKRLRMADGDDIPWDHLVLAPGVQLLPGAVPGLDAAPGQAPDGWTSESGIAVLRERLDAVPADGLVVILAPPAPLRCPPGPYERASMFAHRLRSTGRGGARVIVVDAKETGSLLGLFQDGWERHQPGMVQWLPPSIHGGVERVDPARGTVVTDLSDLQADLVCAVPPQRAGRLAQPFADPAAGGWCAVDPATMRSAAHPDVFVVGDAARLSPPVPKSAVAAAASGRIAAAAVLESLGHPVPDGPGLRNLCWGRLAPQDAVRSEDTYAVAGGAVRETSSRVSATGEAAALRAAAYGDAERWAGRFGAELYG